MDSKVNEGELEGITPGTEGTTLSALRPMGKAELLSRTFEVRTQGNYVEPGTRIRVTQVNANQIFVEPLS
jgi:membrane-bound ClpP family serine protease